MELNDREIKFDSKQILNAIPFFISNADWVKPEQMQAVYSVVNDPAIDSLMNLANKIEVSHPKRVDTSKCDDSTPLDELVWIEMSEDEARRDFERRYQRYCKLAINGYHLRKDNLKGWQKDLEDALQLAKEDLADPAIIEACNYRMAGVEIPSSTITIKENNEEKTVNVANGQRYKDVAFLLKWCVGIQKIVGQNPSVVKVAEWKRLTECDILRNGHIRFDGTPRQFFEMAEKKGIRDFLPDNPTLSMNVEILTKTTGEYGLRDVDSWNKAKSPPRKRTKK